MLVFTIRIYFERMFKETVNEALGITVVGKMMKATSCQTNYRLAVGMSSS